MFSFRRIVSKCILAQPTISSIVRRIYKSNGSNSFIKRRLYQNQLSKLPNNQSRLSSTSTTDTRHQVADTTAAPYSGICWVNFTKNSKNKHGTGFIYNNSVNPGSKYTLIVTCSHNLVDITDPRKFVSNMVIKPGYNKAEIYPNINPVNNVMFVPSTKITHKSASLAGEDYGAILINQSDVQGVSFKWDFYNDIKVGSTHYASITGYPQEVNGKIVEGYMFKGSGYSKTVQRDEGDILCIDAIDASPGESGSPIYITQQDGSSYNYYAIGIHNHGPPNFISGDKGFGTSALFAKPNIDRWLQEKNAPKVINSDNAASVAFLKKDAEWKIYTQELYAPSNTVIVGANFVDMGTNKLGLKILCTALDGTNYSEVTTNSSKGSFTLPKHDKYFSQQTNSAPSGQVVIAAALYKYSDRHIGLKIKCANVDRSNEKEWQGSGTKFGNLGKHHTITTAIDPIMTDINYTAVTAFGMYSPWGNDTLGLSVTTNVFYW